MKVDESTSLRDIAWQQDTVELSDIKALYDILTQSESEGRLLRAGVEDLKEIKRFKKGLGRAWHDDALELYSEETLNEFLVYDTLETQYSIELDKFPYNLIDIEKAAEVMREKGKWLGPVTIENTAYYYL